MSEAVRSVWRCFIVRNFPSPVDFHPLRPSHPIPDGVEYVQASRSDTPSTTTVTSVRTATRPRRRPRPAAAAGATAGATAAPPPPSPAGGRVGGRARARRRLRPRRNRSRRCSSRSSRRRPRAPRPEEAGLLKGHVAQMYPLRSNFDGDYDDCFFWLEVARIAPIFTISGQGPVSPRTWGAPPPTLIAA